MKKGVWLLGLPILLLGLAVWLAARAAQSWRPQRIAAAEGAQFLWVSPDGKWLATGSNLEPVRLVNLETGNAQLTVLHGQTGRFSPDSRRLFSKMSPHGSSGETVYLASMEDPRKAKMLPLGPKLDAIGETAASAESWDRQDNLLGFYSNHSRRWRPPQFREEKLPRLRLKPSSSQSAIYDANFSPDGSLLALSWYDGSRDGSSTPTNPRDWAEVRDTSTGRQIFRVALSAHSGLYQVVVSPDNRYLAAWGDLSSFIYVYEVRSGKLLWKSEGNQLEFANDSATALRVSFTTPVLHYYLCEAATGKVLSTVIPIKPLTRSVPVLSADGNYAYGIAKGSIYRIRLR